MVFAGREKVDVFADNHLIVVFSIEFGGDVFWRFIVASEKFFEGFGDALWGVLEAFAGCVLSYFSEDLGVEAF